MLVLASTILILLHIHYIQSTSRESKPKTLQVSRSAILLQHTKGSLRNLFFQFAIVDKNLTVKETLSGWRKFSNIRKLILGASSQTYILKVAGEHDINKIFNFIKTTRLTI